MSKDKNKQLKFRIAQAPTPEKEKEKKEDSTLKPILNRKHMIGTIICEIAGFCIIWVIIDASGTPPNIPMHRTSHGKQLKVMELINRYHFQKFVYDVSMPY